MSLEKDLKQIGLKDNEVKVFLAVLELGETTVGEIEKQISLHRQLIYNATDSLQADGLLRIREIRGRKHFSVPNPSALEQRAKENLKKTSEIVPKLIKKANKKKSVDEVSTYRGIRAVQNYYIESIQQQALKSEVSILGVSSERYFELFPPEGLAFKRFESMRVDKKIKLKLLLFGAPEKEIAFNKNRSFLEMRLLSDLVEAPNDIVVWKDRVGMLFYGSDPYVLDLSGEQTVKGFQQYIEVLWGRGMGI